jgi:hypothetical protein
MATLLENEGIDDESIENAHAIAEHIDNNFVVCYYP